MIMCRTAGELLLCVEHFVLSIHILYCVSIIEQVSVANLHAPTVQRRNFLHGSGAEKGSEGFWCRKRNGTSPVDRRRTADYYYETKYRSSLNVFVI